MRRTLAAAAVAVALFGVSCDAAGPDLETQLFRLHSVNGQLLPYVPPPSLGFIEPITHGDLFLRSDGSFAWGLGTSLGGLLTGTYQRSSGGFTINSSPPNSITFNGLFSADSAIIDVPGNTPSGDVPGISPTTQPRRYVFVRATPSPGAVGSGRYALTGLGSTSTVAGGFVVFDTTVGSTRYVTRAADTLTFSDGVFFTRAFVSHDSSYFQGIALAAGSSFLLSGSYTGTSTYIMLRRYMTTGQVNMATRDSLVIDASGQLVRVSRIPRAVYTRIK